MSSSAHHFVVVGPRRAARRETFDTIGPVDLAVSCHRSALGPYAGVGQILSALVPAVARRRSELVDAHRVALLIAQPELERVIGPPAQTLVDCTPPDERTRFFGAQLIRAVSHGVITFLLEYAGLIAPERGSPLTLAFDDVHGADPTEQELLALILRRADPARLRVVIGTDGAELEEELAGALRVHAERLPALPVPAGMGAAPRGAKELARAYVAADGGSDDPDERRAYEATPEGGRRRLHDERAAELEARADWALRLGAIPYHRERGADPAGAGRRALRTAVDRCVAVGFSAATVEFGLRGRAVCDPVVYQHDFCHFTAKAASALVPLGRVAESLELYRELRRRYTIAQVHMTCAYAIAMLHTRFLSPRDHEQALEWANSARALAGAEPDPRERSYFEVFSDNGIALIAMHRRDLPHALELVSRGIERLERELGADEYVVHRSQLLHNRARVLVALGRLDEAHADFTRLIEWDPFYVEYHADRAGLHRRRGDLAAALRDYDQAVAVSVPLPELFYSRASARAQAGLVAEAIADLDYVLEMEPGFRDAHLTRGTLRLELGDCDGARADARRGLDLDPSDSRLLGLLALAQQGAGELPQARQTFDRAVQADPDFAPVLVNRAVVAFELDDLDGAETDLTAALERFGDDPDVLYNRGFVRQRRGRPAAALEDFDRALALPDADIAQISARRAECAAALPALRLQVAAGPAD